MTLSTHEFSTVLPRQTLLKLRKMNHNKKHSDLAAEVGVRAL